MIVVGLFRVYLGGDGMLMGVVVIIASSLTGIAWRYLRPHWRRDNLYELIGMGLLVHIIMLCCTIFLPIHIRVETSKNIAFALFTIYPLATVLLGKLMIRQADNWENKKALDISEKRWQYALEGAGDGVWDWNPQTGYIFFSNRWKSMLGYDSDDIDNNVHGWQDLLHEKDRDRVLEVVDKFLTKESESFEVEQRLRCKDGSYKWILSTVASGRTKIFPTERKKNCCSSMNVFCWIH
jgi:PAS domain S-box-containing protein